MIFKILVKNDDFFQFSSCVSVIVSQCRDTGKSKGDSHLGPSGKIDQREPVSIWANGHQDYRKLSISKYFNHQLFM